jgi:broad specificity phosphatase PhoE
MLRLYIIRHAQSANNALANQTLRHFDPVLTTLGQLQAQILGQYLAAGDPRDMEVDIRSGYSERADSAGFGITHLYCSAMYRALETTQPVAEALNLQPEVWLELHEEGGVYLEEDGICRGKPGQTRSQIASAFPSYLLPPELSEDGWWNAANGHESRAAAFARAQRVAQALVQRADSDDVIALITHGTFTDRLLKALLFKADDHRFYYMHYNVGITRVEFVENGPILLRYLNRIDHLSSHLIS